MNKKNVSQTIEISFVVSLKRKIAILERLLHEKTSTLSHFESSLESKVSREEMGVLAQQKADVIELQNLVDLVTTQIAKVGNTDEKDAALMSQLKKHMKDMETNYRASLATKEEVNFVTTKIFGDIRTLKNNTVPLQVFNESLPKKTDASEFKKAIALVYNALADMKDQGETGIGHMRCLVCDKVADRMAGQSSTSSSSTQDLPLYYAKVSQSAERPIQLTGLQGTSNLPSSTLARINSKNPAVSNREKAKVSTDVMVMKSTVDLAHKSDGLLSQSISNVSVSSSHNYKQRIRSAAGGGMQSSFHSDTR